MAKRQAKGATKRPPTLSSPKAADIVTLVEELSAGLGTRDGVVVGRGLARILEEAYRVRRRPVPAWVEQLIAYYRPSGRPSRRQES
jgi:hypothetical protein